MKTTRDMPALMISLAALLVGCEGEKPGGGAVSRLGAGTAGGVPLLTELPPAIEEGTEKPIALPNLVRAPEKAPRFLVPEGTVNVARGKTVTSSDDAPLIGTIDMVTDGEKEGGEGYFVELWEGPQWVQVDLGESVPIHAVWVWHFHSEKRAYHDVIVQVSDDPGFREGVTTLYNNDFDGSAKMGEATDNPYVESRFGLLVDGQGARGRYVRLHSAGNTTNGMNHYIEVEVFGVPGTDAESTAPVDAEPPAGPGA